MSATYTSTEEIFAVGKWNGQEFSAADLQSIADVYNTLRGDGFIAPLKLGHSGDRDTPKGQPALGWVEELWVEGSKLMAKLTDIPEKVYEAMRDKRYRNKSIELDLGVEYKDKLLPMVLTGLALLGAELPAVHTLDDLGNFEAMRRDVDLVFSGRRAEFTYHNLEETDMSDEIAELKRKLAEAEGKAQQFEAQASAASAQLDANNKAAFDREVATVRDTMESMVKDGKLTPGKRDEFSAKLASATHEDRAQLDIVSAVLDSLKESGAQFGAKPATTPQGENTDPGDSYDNAATEVLEKARTISTAESCDMFEARRRLFQREPKLAADYINQR